MNKITILLLTVLLAGCAAIPKQVVDAMAKQKEEIARVKQVCFDNMNSQLDAIEKYRLSILDIYEAQLKDRYRKSPGVNKKTDGTITETLVAPTGDDDVDVINISHLKKIENFFDKQRDSVKVDILKRRNNIHKAEQNFENIEQLNAVVNDYLTSLVSLKESQDKLAKSIRNTLGNMVTIPIAIDRIPDPSTIENILKLF